MEPGQVKSKFDPRRLCVAMVALALVAGDSRVLRKHVDAGLAAYRNKDFTAAAKAFADADLVMPGNATVEFNRACAEARAQNRDGARKLFKSAAAGKDQAIAIAAHYNLGCIEAREARAVFGDAPEDLSKAKRQKGLEYLTTAVGHYRDCLAINPKHENARRNIEIIRLWLSGMRQLWKDRDENTAENSEQKEPLASLVAKLDKRQRDVYTESRNLIRRDYESPPAHIQNQDSVLRRLVKLKQRIEEDFEQAELRESLDSEPQEQVGQSDLAQKAALKDLLLGKADEIEELAKKALDATSDHNHEAAMPLEVAALDKIDELYGAVADLPHLARRALFIASRQQRSVAGSIDSKPFDEPMSPGQGNMLLERELRVRTMAKLLVPKGQQLLEGLRKQQQEEQVQVPLNEDPPQKSGYERAAELAIEHGPRVAELAEQTVELQATRRLKEALPLQEEIVTLLQKIVEPLPREENQNEDEDDDQGNENLQQADEDKPNDEEAGEEPQDQENKEEQQQEIRDREEAESLMRQVRDRQQDLKDRKAQLRAMRSQRARVERDW